MTNQIKTTCCKTNEYTKLQPLFRPRTIAVVGASTKPGPGLQVIENLRQLGFEGEIYPVNPKYASIMDIPCYPSLTAIKEAGHEVDMLAILLGRNNVLSVIEEAASIGVKAAWAFAAGFSEAGEEGRELNDRVKSLCEENGISFVGPNCVGYLNPAFGSGTYSAPMPVKLNKGNIGMVAQSGYLNIAVANSVRGLGFSLMVSTGNEMIVDSTQVMEYMLDDPCTDVIMAFIEQIRRPEAFKRVAERARRVGKPIIMIKVGRSEMAQRATSAHTGALAGSDAVQDSLFKKLGVIRVNDLDEMFETAELFAKLKGRQPNDNGIYAVTLSGGVISLMADAGDGLDICFPEWSKEGQEAVQGSLMSFSHAANPLDAWGSGRIETTYPQCLTAAAAEPGCSLILVVQDVPPGMAPRQVEQYSVVANAAAEVFKNSDKPVVMLTNTSTGVHPEIKRIMDEAGVPVLQGTREGLKAIESLCRFSKAAKKEAAEKLPDTFPLDVSDIFADGRRSLTEYESKKILSTFGVPCTKESLCGDVEECVRAAEELGYPVVLKVMSPAILHKTEAKVIGIGLKNADEIREAYPRLMANAKAFAPNAKIDGMLVQQMAKKPVAEVILGITRDAQFGPAVVYGTGGIFVEILKDSALGIPPLTEEECLDMIKSTKGYRMLTGFRGAPKADVAALAKAIVQISRMAYIHNESIAALDINPLLVYPEGEGVLAVDALLELR